MAYNELNARIASGEMVIVEFYAEWNGDCNVTRIAIEELSLQMQNRVKHLRIDIDLPQNYPITKAYNIYSVPTVVLFYNGRIEWRARGVRSARQLNKIVVRLLKSTIAL
jgi:thioredoxin 1